MKKGHTENIIEGIQVMQEMVVMEEGHVMRPELERFDELKMELKFKLERTLSK